MARPNILWITLDSVRADHTSLHGYERDTTPNMATLGEEGYAFDTCITHSKSTLPSSGAILSGFAPTRNTLGVDGDVLPDDVRTIAERFSGAGYRTACLSRNSFVSSATGLDRGFDRFQWLASETIREAGLWTLTKYLLNIRKHSAGLTRDTAKHASPYLMNDVAKRWLSDFEGEDEPFFFYLHYNEPHRPYHPPLSYIDEYADDLSMSPREAAEFAVEVHYDLDEIIANGCDLSDDEWAALEAMYDAEIAYTDEMVGRLIDYVDSLDMDDTVVVVTGDHGELFGEYGLLSHGYVLIDAVTRVPLVIDGIGDLSVDGDDIVQHADVMKTLLELAGADSGETIGVDLREEGREYAVSQRGPVDFDNILKYNQDFDHSKFHHPTLHSIRSDEHRYLYSEEKKELFRLSDEETDVSDELPEVAEDLESRLTEWLEQHGDPIDEGRNREYSEAVQRQLGDLGYLE